MKKGIFIVLEGGEGAGKSVQARQLTERLRERGYRVTSTREPGGTRIGEQIRAITHDPENVDLHPKTEAYLMAAARAQHVAETIAPALDAGRVVVCDRFLDSSLAYQGHGRQLGEDVIVNLNTLAVNGVLPDLTILLNVSPKVGIARRHASAKANDRLDMQQHDFYERVYAGYLALAKQNPSRYLVIDAAAPVEKISDLIWSHVEKLLEKPGEN
jgi:dTMP kinase